MSYHFPELDAETRRFMLADALEDVARGRLMLNRRLTDEGRAGRQQYRRVNSDVATRLVGETEFNIYYMRSLCRKLMAEGVTRVMAYRAKHVDKPRAGKRVNPGDIGFTCEALDDLRQRGEEGSLRGFLRGPYSGISLQRVPPELPLEWQVIASDVVPPPDSKR